MSKQKYTLLKTIQFPGLTIISGMPLFLKDGSMFTDEQNPRLIKFIGKLDDISTMTDWFKKVPDEPEAKEYLESDLDKVFKEARKMKPNGKDYKHPDLTDFKEWFKKNK